MLSIAVKLNNLEWMACAIEQCGGLDAIEDLQQHENEEVFSMAQGLIDMFFSAEVFPLLILFLTEGFFIG